MRNRRRAYIALFAVAAAGFAVLGIGQPAQATIYIQFPGGTVPGNARANGLPPGDWVAASSLQFGVSRSISKPTGGSADRESSAPSVSEMVVTLAGANVMPAVFLSATIGKPGVIRIVVIPDRTRGTQPKTGALGSSDTPLQFTLDNAMIGSLTINSNGDEVTASLSLNFTRIEMTAGEGKPGGPGSASWDFSRAALE